MYQKLPINKKMIESIWQVVLILPGILAAKTWPLFSAKIKRKPVTANSRQTIIATTHAGASFKSTQ